MAERGPRARPGGAFLGLSLALHGLALGLGAGAVLWQASGAASVPRTAVALAIEASPELPPEREVPEPEPDLPPIEVDELPEVEDRPEPSPDAEPREPLEERPTPLDLAPLLPPDWALAPLERPPEPAAEPPEPAAPPEELARREPASAPSGEPAADVPPTLLEAPSPDYPGRARRLGQEGSVDCLLSVAADGGVRAVRVVRSSGFEVLDRAAREALLRWRFRPGLRLGVAASFEVRHRVTFVLR